VDAIFLIASSSVEIYSTKLKKDRYSGLLQVE